MDRIRKLIAVSVLIGAISLVGMWVVLSLVADVDLSGVLERVDPVLMLAAVGLHCVFWLFWGLRTWVLSRGAGIRISPGRSLSIVLSSLFAAAITPSYAGGEPVRFYLLAEDGNGGTAGSIVFVERFLDSSLFAIISFVSAFYLYYTLHIPILKWAFLAAGLLMLLIMGLFLLSLRSVGTLERLLKGLLYPVWRVRPGVAGSLEARVEEGVEEFHESVSTFVGQGRTVLLAAAALTCVQWGAEFLIPYVLFQGLGASITVLEAVAGNAMLTVLLMLPFTPGGSGIAEVGAVGVFGLFDSSPAVAFFPLPWRIVTYYTNLFVGLVVSALLLRDLDLVQDTLGEIR